MILGCHVGYVINNDLKHCRVLEDSKYLNKLLEERKDDGYVYRENGNYRLVIKDGEELKYYAIVRSLEEWDLIPEDEKQKLEKYIIQEKIKTLFSDHNRTDCDTNTDYRSKYRFELDDSTIEMLNNLSKCQLIELINVFISENGLTDESDLCVLIEEMLEEV